MDHLGRGQVDRRGNTSLDDCPRPFTWSFGWTRAGLAEGAPRRAGQHLVHVHVRGRARRSGTRRRGTGRPTPRGDLLGGGGDGLAGRSSTAATEVGQAFTLAASPLDERQRGSGGARPPSPRSGSSRPPAASGRPTGPAARDGPPHGRARCGSRRRRRRGSSSRPTYPTGPRRRRRSSAGAVPHLPFLLEEGDQGVAVRGWAARGPDGVGQKIAGLAWAGSRAPPSSQPLDHGGEGASRPQPTGSGTAPRRQP